MGITNMIEYIPLGTIDRIGSSCHYLKLDEWGLLLDAGLDPDPTAENPLPDYDIIKDQPVNAIIISHAHLDHLGSLPIAIQYFPKARVYMTQATAALSEIMLFHYLKVQERKSQLNGKTFTPLYTVETLENVLYLFQSFNYNFPFKIHSFQESKITLTFWDAGHILGSAGVEIKWRGKKIFYTGNTKKASQFILRGARYPKKTDILITETTYGNNEDAPNIKKKQEMNRFAQFVIDRLNFGGSVLIPVFALGKTQEIMMLLHKLIKMNKLPPVPIYILGFGTRINKVYDNLMHKIYPQYDMKFLHTISYASLSNRNFRKPSIILATSGMMLPQTLSYEIARDFLNNIRNGIAIVGWADPETPGGSLREKKIDKIKNFFGKDHIACGIDIFLFSAHSHREELISMAKLLRPQKTVLCHGEPAALEWIKERLRLEKISEQIIIPLTKEKIQLL